MGSFFAGLGSLIGGAGEAAQAFGQQVRGHLEARRHHFAELLTKYADEEPDPARRGELLSHAADLYQGKDISKIAPAVIKTVQNHHESNDGLAQMLGGPPKDKPQPPVPQGLQGVPQTLPQLAMPGSAAQPASSPVAQPEGGIRAFRAGFQAPDGSGRFNSQRADVGDLNDPNGPAPGTTQIQPLPSPVAQAAAPPSPSPSQPPQSSILSPPPGPVSTLDIYNKYHAIPEFSTPQGYAHLKPSYDAEVAHNEGLRQQLEQAQFGHAATQELIQRRVAQLKSTGDWDRLSPRQRTDVMLGSVNITPELRPVQVPGTISTPPGATDPFGNPITTAQVRMRTLPDGTVEYHPVVGVTHQVAKADPNSPNGYRMVTVDATGREIGDVAGGQAVLPSSVTPHSVTDQAGQIKFLPQSQINKGNFQNPQFAPVTRSSSSTPTPEGGTINTSTVRRGVGQLPAVGGAAGPLPAPPITGTGTPNRMAPSMGKPFTPASPLDHLVMQIAQDSANEKLISARGPFSANNPSKAMVNARMAELGLDPNNLSSSMRDRATQAQTLLPHLDAIQGIINQAEKDGDLGVVASRWNEFLVGKVQKDMTKSQVFTKLRTEMQFLTTGVGMAHGGQRAASSAPIIEHWEDVLKAADPNTLREKLRVARDWVQGYAKIKMPDVNITPPGGPAPSGSGPGPGPAAPPVMRQPGESISDYLARKHGR